MGLAAVLALQLLVALALGKRVFVYMVQEVLVVILLIAMSVAALLLLLVAFVLSQEGIRRAALCMKTGVLRLAKLNHRHSVPPAPIIPPPLQR